ncbi:MAG: V-type ATP synthase subunit A [Candidatus Delongbacteria bacterium]|nr:V-type ATP synthase subunit A [Candidatus Delongbacteria bacterium]
MTENQGKIIKITGPVVQGVEIPNPQMGDQVFVGAENLIGEIIKIFPHHVIIQVYEDTSGIRPGDPIVNSSRPISAQLGPGMIGSIYDGIQRPLNRIHQQSQSSFIQRGINILALDETRSWSFQPQIKINDSVAPNSIIGHIQETPLIIHKILLPHGLSGKVKSVKPQGDYTINDPIAVILDSNGKEHSITMHQFWPIRKSRPVKTRLGATLPLLTGQRIIDFFFPIVKGGVAAIPGGFGTGKTVTQHQLAKWSDADIIVYIGCGERGNEMTQVLDEFPHLIDPKSNRPLMERTILIANTSNMPVTARESSIYTGITMAEYYRDMGYNVAIMADSTSRWAEALREISGRLEEMPADEGYPAYLPSRLAEFYERAGQADIVPGRQGSISIIGAVSPPGGDFSEPVTMHTKRFTRCFWALNKELAGARHFPAISWLESYSQYAPYVKSYWDSLSDRYHWEDMRAWGMDVLQQEDKLQQIVKLVGQDALPDDQRLILEVARIIKIAFLQQAAFDPIDTFCSSLKQLMMFDLIHHFYQKAHTVISAGCPVTRIQSLTSLQTLLRMKTKFSNEALDDLQKVYQEINEDIVKLELIYSK